LTGPTPGRLEDGTLPATPEELLALLVSWGIPCETHVHPPAFTVEQARALKGDLPGAHTKNLFLRDRRRRMWLVVALHDRVVDLRAMADKVRAAGRLSFASEERLMRFLGLTPGSVTPFGLVNDHGRTVSVALDQGLRGHEWWNAHPLVNTATTRVRVEDMLRFLGTLGYAPEWVDLEGSLEGDGAGR